MLTGMFLFTSCFSHLDKFPEGDTTGREVFGDMLGVRMALAKVYGALLLTGQDGPNGRNDIYAPGLDEGDGCFFRTFFTHQQVPTDETHNAWNNPGLPEMNHIAFPANPLNMLMYSRSLMHIQFANNFLRNTLDGDMADRGFSPADRAEIAVMRAEVRFLRAFQYWVMMDIFANPPFIDENMLLGVAPRQKSENAEEGRRLLFNWIESELLDLVNNNLLRTVGTNETGRVCEAAAWALLARFYLNANVYNSPVGTPGNNTDFFTQAIYFANRVISSGQFQIYGNYEHLFLNDNRRNPEFIWALHYDGLLAQTWGGINFLINAGSSNDAAFEATFRYAFLDYGLRGNWRGLRARSSLVNRFEPGDRRSLFVGANPEIRDETQAAFEYYGSMTFKFRNIPSIMVVPGCERTMVGGRFEGCTVCSSVEGAKTGCHLVQYHLDNNIPFGRNPGNDFADNSFPLFRLAEMVLIYAEAIARGGSGGNTGTALANLNLLQERAFGVGFTPITSLDLDWIIDERSRELFWEGHRRTDLVRFNRFTSGPSWEWRGGTFEGTTVSPHLNIFPLPATDIMANPNLRQNPGF